MDFQDKSIQYVMPQVYLSGKSPLESTVSLEILWKGGFDGSMDLRFKVAGGMESERRHRDKMGLSEQ